MTVFIGSGGKGKDWYKQYTGGGISKPGNMPGGKATQLDIPDRGRGRLTQSKLPGGGMLGNAVGKTSSSGRSVVQPQVISGWPGFEKDWRVRLSLPPGATGFYLDSPLMAPLKETSGLIWPVTPTILLQHSTNYTPQEPVHTNYPYYAYNNSRVDAITIVGNFPVQNTKEGAYWLGALHFLRSVSKMFYGPGESQGNPPQVLRLNGYGDHILRDVSVIVEQVTVELGGNVDYISVMTEGEKEEVKRNKKGKGPSRGQQRIKKKDGDAGSMGVTRVPTDSTFTVLVQPIYSRKKIKDKFNLKDFANGTLAKDGFI